MTTLGRGANERTHTLHVKSNITPWTRPEPDWDTVTLLELDHQNIYWETRWPLFSVSDIFENNQLHPSLQDVLPNDVVEMINSFTDTQRLKFIDVITSRNCYLV